MSETNRFQVGLIIGSLRRDSINRKLADGLRRLAPQTLLFKELKIDDLPPYNQDDDTNQPTPTKRLKGELQASQALLFVTPEYNRSIPGVLKNVLDHASRPYGQNAWAGKPTGILSASLGAHGGAMAQQHLRNILAYLDVPTMGQPEAFIHVKEGFFDVNGDVADADSKKFLQKWLGRYVAWIQKMAG